jgi:hypothetical protein
MLYFYYTFWVKNQQLFVPVAKRPGYGFMKYFYYTFCQGYINYPPAAYVVTFALLYSYVSSTIYYIRVYTFPLRWWPGRISALNIIYNICEQINTFKSRIESPNWKKKSSDSRFSGPGFVSWWGQNYLQWGKYGSSFSVNLRQGPEVYLHHYTWAGAREPCLVESLKVMF